MSDFKDVMLLLHQYYSRIRNSLPLHVTSAPEQTFRRRGWSRFCSAAVSQPDLSFPI